jgi:hypothetical protein
MEDELMKRMPEWYSILMREYRKRKLTGAFNYVTGVEIYTNLDPVNNMVNVWEDETLNYDIIVDRVKKEIESTMV